MRKEPPLHIFKRINIKETFQTSEWRSHFMIIIIHIQYKGIWQPGILEMVDRNGAILLIKRLQKKTDKQLKSKLESGA